MLPNTGPTTSDPAALDVDWEGCQLNNAYLNGANLVTANLSGALWINGMQCAKVPIGECK
ncbi:MULTISPECIES: pentapeptide repeat-containing protein [unclassified Marinobacter]|uniref:pentapeptide repeat-containing protein n=1 Tax=unclassified Marinobacter TaxID=83889 RepID=UPI00118127C7